MNRIFFCFALCLAAPAHAVNPWMDTRHAREKVTVDYLFESCSVVGETAHGMIPHFDCESFTYGVLDSYLSVRDSIPKASRACFPANLPPWKALEAASAEINDKNRTKLAAPFLIEALRKKHPCR
jgi:hypothetical protein